MTRRLRTAVNQAKYLCQLAELGDDTDYKVWARRALITIQWREGLRCVTVWVSPDGRALQANDGDRAYHPQYLSRDGVEALRRAFAWLKGEVTG